MSATINIFDNPIEKRSRSVQADCPCSVRDAIKGLNPDYCIIYVNGEPKDCDYMLEDGDICTVRQYAGSSAGEVFMNILVPGYSVFKPVVQAGLKKLATWLIGKPDSGTSTDSKQGEKTPTISGCRNSPSNDKPVPFILGKTLMTPYLIGQPYTTIDTSTDRGESYFHGLFLVGYNKLQIRDIALGNYIISPNDGSSGCVSQNDYTTAQATDLESGFPSIKKTGAFYPPASYQPKIEIQQGANEVSLYPQKVIQENFGDVISGKAFGDNYFNFFSARYPHKVEVQIKFPNGLIAYDKKGKKKNHTVDIWLGMSKNGGSTWEPFAYFNRISGSAATSTAAKSTFTRQTKDEMNFVATRTFSYAEIKNVTNNTLEFRIQVGYSEVSSEQYIHDVVIDSVRTWCYDPDESKAANSIVVQRPMVASRRNRTARIGLQIKAAEDIQNTLGQLNCICTSKARTWNGSAWSSGVSATNNPASLILLAMQGVCRGNKPYPDSRIDFASLGAFYSWCADTSAVGDGLPRFSCNGAILNRTKTSDVLRQIASCGRGSLGINGDKYCIEIDSPRSVHVMVLNEQNILEQTNRKEFDELPDGFECRFVNAMNYYQEDSLVVWFDTTTHPDVADRILETVEYPFITDAKRVVRQAWYDYACRKLRPETWDVKVATEGNLIEPGDLVEIQGSSISVGIGEGAEIKSLVTSGNYITKIKTDGRFVVTDVANVYGCRITTVNSYGSTVVLNLKLTFNQVGTYDTLTFDSPVSLDASAQPCVGDIVSFGLYNSETADALCIGKKDNGDGTFNITLTPYQPGIYTAETGKVPEYDSKLTTPLVAGLPVGKQYATIDDVNNALDFIINGDADMIPEDVLSLTAVAGENGLTMTPVYTSLTLMDSVTFKYQIKRGSSAEWADISVRNGFYTFDRTVDGFPEKATLDTWQVRVKAVNLYGNESENWKTALVDSDDYGTWLVQPPVITERTNKRSLHIHLKQPTGQREIYGNVRYQIQISRYDDMDGATRLWYKPNLSSAADPYGAETNYKVDTDPAPDPAYVIATDDFSQTVPLQGQSATPAAPGDTVYYYRVLAFNEAGCAMHEVEGVSVPYYAETNQMTARATGARDVVLARLGDGSQHPDALTAKNIYAENLTAIAGTFSQVQGDSETSDNFWKGMDTNNPEFRVGNDHNLEEQDDEDAEYIHYKDGSLAMKLKNFIVTVAETTIKGTLTLYNAAKTFRNLVSSAGMRFQKKVTDWLNPVDVAQVTCDENGNIVITNSQSSLPVYRVGGLASSAKLYHLDTALTDTAGNNPEGLSAASGGCGATAEPVLTDLTAYFSGTLKKTGVVARSAPAYNKALRSISGFTILGICNGIAAGYTVSGNVYTCKTYDIATGTLRTSFNHEFGSNSQFRKVKAFWAGDQFVFMTSYYASIQSVSSEWYWYCYMQDGTPRWGSFGGGQDTGCAYNSATGTYRVFAVKYSGKTLYINGYDLGGYGSFSRSFTVSNQYVTQIEACLVAGDMIMLKCNNTNLTSNPWLFGVHYDTTAYITTNIWQNISFVDSWTDYGSNDGYLHTLNTSGTRYLFKNIDLMNPISIDSAYSPIKNGTDSTTVYLYKSGDTSIYTLVNGTYTKLGASAAVNLFDNRKRNYATTDTIYYFPAYNQTLTAVKHYAFWFKGSSIKFGKVTIATDAANWLYCRLTASGSTISWKIVRATLNNGALSVFANSSASIAGYGPAEENANLDFVLFGSVEEFTVDSSDISDAMMLNMVKYKLPYSNPGTAGNLPLATDADKFTMLAKYPDRVLSNVIGAAEVISSNISLGNGTMPGMRRRFITTAAVTISYVGLNSACTDSLNANITVEYTWTGSAWFCTSAPPIGRIIEQKPDEPTPAAMYGGQWVEHNYGGVFFRSKGGDSCGFHAAFRVSSWGSGTSVTLVDTPVDGNGTTITSSNCANYIIVAGNSYSKISSVSGKTLTLSSAISGYANITDVIIGQAEGIPDIDLSFRTTAWGGDVRTWGSAIQETYIGGNFVPGGNDYPDRIYRIHLNNSNPVYRNTLHIAPNVATLCYWRRFQ